MVNLAQGWIDHLRRRPRDDQARHPDGDVQLSFKGPNSVGAGSPDLDPSDAPARMRLKRPTTSDRAGDRRRSPSPSKRSKARHNTLADESTANFSALLTARTKGRLWNEGDPIQTCNQAAAQPEFLLTIRERLDAVLRRKYADLMPNDVSPEAMQARIQQARREAKTLKDRIERKKEELKTISLRQLVTAQDQILPAGVRSSLNTSYRACERRFLPLEINGKPVNALPDTGVTGNAICEDYALDIGAIIERPPSKHHFANAKNQPFESVGTTKLTISIPEALSKTYPRMEWVCSFVVVKHLAAPLVLGNQFLRKTEALVTLAHLMVRKTISVMSDRVDGLKKVWRFMHMNLPTQKLGCSLDAEPAFAALDSGSDIDVVSLTYAKFREWQIEPLPEGEGYVLLANNELVKLAGYVETTLGIRGGCIPRRLHVLDGLVCDVVLGDPTIETLDIFNRFQSSLVDTTAAEDMDPFHMIQWVEEIDQIEHELEELLAERPSAVPSGTAKTGWRSFFRNGALRRGKSADGEGIVNRLNNMLENVEVRSANWRRAAEAELLILVGDEHTRKREEFDKRKKQNDGLRDKIRQNINVRLQIPKPELRRGSGKPKVAANTSVMF